MRLKFRLNIERLAAQSDLNRFFIKLKKQIRPHYIKCGSALIKFLRDFMKIKVDLRIYIKTG